MYFSFIFLALSRSRDRPVLVCGPWSETNRALWEEAQPRRGSGQRGGKICRQDAAAAQQPQKRAETGEQVGCRGQGLVPVMARPPPRNMVKVLCHFAVVRSSIKWLKWCICTKNKQKNLYWLINQDVVIVNICSDFMFAWTHFFSKQVKLNIANFIHQYTVAHTVDSLFFFAC